MWLSVTENLIDAIAAREAATHWRDGSAERWYQERKRVYAVDHGEAWRRAGVFCFGVGAALLVLQGATRWAM